VYDQVTIRIHERYDIARALPMYRLNRSIYGGIAGSAAGFLACWKRYAGWKKMR